MTKAELVEKIYVEGSLKNKADAEKALNAIGIVLQDDFILNGGSVAIPHLGTFHVKERKERTGRNPQTGENITIPAKKVVAFKPSKALAEKLNA